MAKKLAFLLSATMFYLFQIVIFLPQIASASNSGLQLEWKFDEGTGTTAIDSSGNGNTGTIYNNASYVSGVEGTAVSLNGINQYVEVNSPFAFLGTVDQPYALSAWVNVPNAGESGNIIHISSNADGSGWCIPFLALNNGVFSATGWDNSGVVHATDSTQIQPNQWYQVITTWDPSNGLRLFVNGTLVQSTPQPDYAASGSPMYFSAGLANVGCSGNEGFLDGSVDDARLYSSVLTPTDVQNINSVGDPPSNTASNNSSSPTTTTTSKDSAPPDTGFGTPNTSNLINGLSLVALVSIAGGISLIHRRKRT